MREKFRNYEGNQIRCIFNGFISTALFEKSCVKFVSDDAHTIAVIRYVDINNLFRGIFPNQLNIHFKEGEDKYHTVQLFRVTKFMEYINWGKLANQDN